ncbi:flagellar protein FlaG [uncultured Ferrimonas sp.]|uniref:flagellar protein FlaG n=1 Tax=uncultured Ferrimonas sp. TaxID=432640 RepID=UPI00261A15E2|nr:flagellar protein FlaG [uncultured Ferrimonas sp.]
MAELQRQDPTAVGAEQAPAKVNASTEASGQQPLSKEQLTEVAAELERFMNTNQRSLSFHVDDDTGRDVVTVKDLNTNEVIRQFPSEEVLDLAARLSDLSGLLFNTKA